MRTKPQGPKKEVQEVREIREVQEEGTKVARKKRVRPAALDDYSDAERAYFRALPRETRLKIIDSENRVAEYNNVAVPVRFKVLQSELDDHVKAIAVRKLEHLAGMDDHSSGEYFKMTNWVELLCRLPVGRYASLPISSASCPKEIAGFVQSIAQRMDAAVYGHSECKDHILRILCQWITNPTAKGVVIGIQGAAGVGKTSLVKEGVCKALQMPFAFIPLGGASDGAFLEGHSYTYEGAVPGRVVDVLVRAQCMNPVLFFDETDKVSASHRGQEVSNILIHLTDSSQNEKFHDRYFSDIPLDLSRCLMIFSFNDVTSINPILLDRMTVINVEGYTAADKLKIAEKHLIPEILKDFNMLPTDIVFSDGLLRTIIDMTDPEEGVRNLKRSLHKIISSVNMQRLMRTRHLPCVLKTEDVQALLLTSRSGAFKHCNTMYI